MQIKNMQAGRFIRKLWLLYSINCLGKTDLTCLFQAGLVWSNNSEQSIAETQGNWKSAECMNAEIVWMLMYVVILRRLQEFSRVHSDVDEC